MKKVFIFLAAIFLITGSIFAHSGDSLNVPWGTTPTIDGNKSAGEWNDAHLIQTLNNGIISSIYVKHNATHLFVAFDSPFSGSAGVYIDKLNNGGTFPNTDDIWIHGSAGPFEFIGTDTSWLQLSTPTNWNFTQNIANGFSEFKISLAKLGVSTGINNLGVLFCLLDWSVGHTSEITWPSGGYPNCGTPNSWANMNIDLTNAAIENFDINKIKVYPNPTTDYIVIDNKNNETINYAIYNLIGQAIKDGKTDNNYTKINISDLRDGVYFVKLFNDAKSKVIKFTKKQ